MRGKYSPTVNAAYRKDQSWHDKYKSPNEPNYDPEGFDMYGYDENDIDRAGNEEHEYYPDDIVYDDDMWSGDNWKYNDALDDWGFDGVKPVRIK